MAQNNDDSFKVGAKGFSKEYWEENYSEPESMDCIGNISEHAQYLKNLFDLEFIDVSSIIDFGFGLGHLFEEFLSVFIPYKAIGIEPSKHAYDVVKKRGISPVESTSLKLHNTDLLSWLKKASGKSDGAKRLITPRSFDLGICTSVFQYLTDEEIEEALPLIAKRVKYLYFTVPTDKELARQVEELEFEDMYAIKRSRTKYQKLIKKYFTVVSSRVLESKEYFDEESTSFTDLLYRF